MSLRKTLEYTICLYAFLSPMFYFKYGGVNIVTADFLSLLVVSLWVVVRIQENEFTLQISKPFLVLFALAMFGIASTIYSPVQFEAFGSGLLFVWLLTTSVVLYNVLQNSENPVRLFRLLILSLFTGSIIISFYIFYLRFQEIGYLILTPEYGYPQRTQLPYQLVPLAAASAVFYAAGTIFNRTVSAAMYFATTLIILISLSRGPWVAMAAGLVSVFILHRPIRQGFIRINLGPVLIGVVLTILTGQSARMLDRIGSIFRPTDVETIGRVELYIETLNVMISNILGGIGLNNYEAIYGHHPHSTYMMFGAELGIFALLAYLAIPIWMGRQWLAILIKGEAGPRGALTAGLMTGILTLFVGQIVSSAIFWFRSYWVLFAMAIASLGIYKSGEETHPSDPLQNHKIINDK